MKDLSFRGKVDGLLETIEEDLKRLPRHEWDKYLWDICCRFVHPENGEPAVKHDHHALSLNGRRINGGNGKGRGTNKGSRQSSADALAQDRRPG